MITNAGETISIGDQVATRRNDRDLGVANRDRWTVTAINDHGLTVRSTTSGRGGERRLPGDYVRAHVELAYATTVHGAQGDTLDTAHFLLGESTGAAAACVAMTRGRHHNTAHLVADTVPEARAQWIEVFNRDRADLGPSHAANTAADDIERYGPQPAPRPPRDRESVDSSLPRRPPPDPPPMPGDHTRGHSPGIGR